MDKRLLLASPHMSDEGYELEYIHDAFQKNWIAPLGENVNEFEKAMGTYMGKGYPVALSAGTAALHLAMILAGVKRGDAVFCQSLTFSASANPVVYCGAKPVFIDSEQETWNMDPAALRHAFELYGMPKAVVAVHLYGNPAKLDEITAICREHNVPLIEDAAEALGSTYNGQKCGTFGDFGALSFNGNKIITTSGGGMLLCQTEEEAKHALKLATQARENAPWYQHEEIGFNYRMSNISAGIGRGQMKVLPLRVEQKRAIFARYSENLKDLPLTIPPRAIRRRSQRRSLRRCRERRRSWRRGARETTFLPTTLSLSASGATAGAQILSRRRRFLPFSENMWRSMRPPVPGLTRRRPRCIWQMPPLFFPRMPLVLAPSSVRGA